MSTIKFDRLEAMSAMLNPPISKIVKHALIRNVDPKLRADSENRKPEWCYMVTSIDELALINDGLFDVRGINYLYGKGAWKGTDFSFSTFNKFENRREKAWLRLIDEGKAVYVRYNGGWTYQHDSIEVLEVRHLLYPEHPTDKFADIVVCENDPMPEEWWIEVLKNKYPDKSICVLTQFSERSLENIKAAFEAAKIISFTTTFSSYGWFEKALTAMKEGNMTDKIIFGNKAREQWTVTLPDEVNAEVQHLKSKHRLTIEEYTEVN